MSECTLIAKPPGRRNCRNSSPELAFKAQLPVPGLLPLIMPLTRGYSDESGPG